MKDKAGKVVKYILLVLIAVALVYLAFRGLDWKNFVQGLKGTDWWYIILSMLVFTLAVVFREERWRSQLLPFDSSISRFSVWHASNVGNLLNVAIPGSGELYRCAYVSTALSPYDRTFGTILMERAWDVLAIAVLLAVSVLTNVEVIGDFLLENVAGPFAERFSFSVWWIVGGAIVFAVCAVYLIFRLGRKHPFFAKVSLSLKGIFAGFRSFRQVRSKPLFILYTLGIWMCYILVSYLIFKAVPSLGHLTFADAVFISAVGNIASVIPTPGNIGPYHYLVGLALSTIYLGSGGMEATGLLYATLSHGAHAALILILGLYSYIRVSLKKRQ